MPRVILANIREKYCFKGIKYDIINYLKQLRNIKRKKRDLNIKDLVNLKRKKLKHNKKILKHLKIQNEFPQSGEWKGRE